MEEIKQQKISKRKLPDGTYDKKPLDPEYFKNIITRKDCKLLHVIGVVLNAEKTIYKIT